VCNKAGDAANNNQDHDGRPGLKKFCLMLIAAACALTTVAQAQSWPTRTVRLIVPFAPGSTPDSLGRILADRLQA
jgi:tripartite-type tricarboxylate transporter receptor subunit TctC